MAPSSLPSTGMGLIVTFGEMMIDFAPTDSGVSIKDSPELLKTPAGAPAHVAIAVSRLGGKAAFVGKLGADEFGRMLLGTLKEDDVYTGGVAFDKGARTGLDFRGASDFMLHRNPSADMLLRPDELNLAVLKTARVFHFGSKSLIAEPCRSALMKAIKVAKEAGALISFDPKVQLSMWASAWEARKQILSVWEKADIIKVNEKDVRFLAPTGNCDSLDTLARLLCHDKLKLLVVTMGKRGCNYYTRRCNGTVSAIPVKVVDTTGAGDSFVAGLLAKIVDDHSIFQDEKRMREVLKFSNACAAITCTKKGTIPALPTEKKVMSFGFWNNYKQPDFNWNYFYMATLFQYALVYFLRP